MDAMFNRPSEFAYSGETCEVESLEEHFSQCALNFTMNTLVAGTFVVNSMEDKPIPPAEDVYNSRMDDMSYHSIQDGLD
jgi:hypothetical protein